MPSVSLLGVTNQVAFGGTTTQGGWNNGDGSTGETFPFSEELDATGTIAIAVTDANLYVLDSQPAFDQEMNFVYTLNRIDDTDTDFIYVQAPNFQAEDIGKRVTGRYRLA